MYGNSSTQFVTNFKSSPVWIPLKFCFWGAATESSPSPPETYKTSLFTSFQCVQIREMSTDDSLWYYMAGLARDFAKILGSLITDGRDRKPGFLNPLKFRKSVLLLQEVISNLILDKVFLQDLLEEYRNMHNLIQVGTSVCHKRLGLESQDKSESSEHRNTKTVLSKIEKRNTNFCANVFDSSQQRHSDLDKDLLH